MRMSCNGCRVLRKGCSDSCTIRPCLQWIKNPDSQSNATVFLAKFYGRAGLMNLINAGPDHLRPAVFRSLLYEACGRIVNPVYGSIGLLWSGSWHLCQAAVEAVLRGEPIMQLPAEPAAAPQMKAACDIRHVPREENPGLEGLHKPKSRTRFKRSTRKPKLEPTGTNNSSSRGSSLSRETDRDSMLSVETSLRDDEPAELELELTLGFHASRATASEGTDGLKWDTCKEEMAMDVTA